MIRSLAIIAVGVLATLPATAGNITEQQTCQLTAQHVVNILETKDWKAEATPDIATLNSFIAGLEAVIDQEINASAAQLSMEKAAVQQMVDQQSTTIAAQIDKRYGAEKIYRDYAVSLANCAQAFPNTIGGSPETFIATLERIGQWAQAGR